MILKSYYFDVAERPVFNQAGTPLNGYKAVVIPDEQPGQEQLVSIVKNSYKLVPNRMLIEPFVEEIARLGTRWQVDKSHSFVLPNRMRLQITFPDIYVSDSESAIPLSVYLHNSYDGSEGIRMFWGAIRAICSNGMIMGDVLGKYYARHTKGFDPELIQRQFDDVTGRIHTIRERIVELDQLPVDIELMQQVQKVLGKRRLAEIAQTDSVPDVSQWELYNRITWLVSHQVEKPARADLQLKTSQVFAL
jgi:hypothetical protein